MRDAALVEIKAVARTLHDAKALAPGIKKSATPRQSLVHAVLPRFPKRRGIFVSKRKRDRVDGLDAAVDAIDGFQQQLPHR